MRPKGGPWDAGDAFGVSVGGTCLVNVGPQKCNLAFGQRAFFLLALASGCLMDQKSTVFVDGRSNIFSSFLRGAERL